ncbi:hypothetical protein EGW03_00795 [bacterium]|nr:hypothetical protein [bacterium]
MIIFSEGIADDYLMNSNVSKERIKLLERALRRIGHFDKSKPIEITEYRTSNNILDIIYSVKDLDNTTFEFYNFGLDHDPKSLTRFEKNYQVIMKKANSNFIYKYNFKQYKSIYQDFTEKLRMIEVSQSLPNERVVKLELPLFAFPKVKVEEQEKTYLFIYPNNKKEINMFLLENFDKLVENVKKLKNLNVENLLPLLPHQKQIDSIYIQLGTNKLAQIEFSKGIITDYEINEATKKTNVNLLDNITIKTESGLDGNKSISTQTLTEENYEEILKSDYKRLFKEL